MDFGVHLPLMELSEEDSSFARLEATAEAAAVECGFAAISANDHFIFQVPWLDGPTALASVIPLSGELTLATTVSLAVLRGPVPLAKALTAIDILSNGRVLAGVGPGSSERDYAAIGVPFEERWGRFDEALDALRALLEGRASPWERSLLDHPRRSEAGARAPAAGGNSSVDRKLGLESRPRQGREVRGRLACLRLQHDAGALCRRPRQTAERA